jgi:hypothetical protein
MHAQLTGHQQVLENRNENEPFIPFSPTSSTTVVSLPIAAISPPSPQLQSTAQKALRFLNMPVRARRYEAGAQRPEPAAHLLCHHQPRLQHSCIETCLVV